MDARAEDLPPKGATVEIPGFKFKVEKDDRWENIGMIVVMVLAIYAGIKLINRIFKNDTPDKKVARPHSTRKL